MLINCCHHKFLSLISRKDFSFHSKFFSSTRLQSRELMRVFAYWPSHLLFASLTIFVKRCCTISWTYFSMLLSVFCCRESNHAPWIAFIVVNFERGHEENSWAFWCFDWANSNTACHSCQCLLNARYPLKIHTWRSIASWLLMSSLCRHCILEAS